MNTKTLIQENGRLETLIKNKAAEIGFENKIIFDGVAFPEKYIKSSPHIL